jgi:hypothetical protein
MKPIALAALLLSLSPALATAGWGRQGLNVSTHGGAPMRCGDLEVTIDGRPAAVAEQAMSFAPAAGQAFRVRAARNSGISVEAADRRDVAVLACKAASDGSDLDRIRVTFEDGLLGASGPAGDSWVAYFLIEVPRGSAIDVEAGNGPIWLGRLTGKVTARSQNGPISLKDCAGSVDAQAENGPIGVTGSAGDIRVRTQNGPISVRLSGISWDGRGLDARAVNGPVSLRIPEGYRSGALVASAGRSPFRCKGGACRQANRTWDDDGNRIELGSGPLAVRLSTVNGPVSVAGIDGEED